MKNIETLISDFELLNNQISIKEFEEADRSYSKSLEECRKRKQDADAYIKEHRHLLERALVQISNVTQTKGGHTVDSLSISFSRDYLYKPQPLEFWIDGFITLKDTGNRFEQRWELNGKWSRNSEQRDLVFTKSK